jgi:hypothetical protein
LPAPADGSQDVKQFALSARQSVLPGTPVYLSQEVCTPQAPAIASKAPALEIESIRPSLRFYMDRPLICIEEHQIQAGLHPRHAYVIGQQPSWSRLDHRGRVVFEGHGFVLARWD